MTIEETRERILNDDNFLLVELKRLQVLYGLKDEPRYELARTPTNGIHVESVADHIYALSVLAPYFITLEDINSEWDQNRITTMITYHDIDEIITGDALSWQKGDDRQYERDAEEQVLQSIPALLEPLVRATLVEYVANQTREAQFVRALDKIEPIFHLYNENGKKITLHHNTTAKQHQEAKDPFTKSFPYIHRFHTVMLKLMNQEGFFV